MTAHSSQVFLECTLPKVFHQSVIQGWFQYNCDLMTKRIYGGTCTCSWKERWDMSYTTGNTNIVTIVYANMLFYIATILGPHRAQTK